MEVKHCTMDLRELIRMIEERKQRNIDAVREMDRELTPVENARFEVGVGLMMDLLVDLRQMADGWDQGLPNYRITEKALEEPDGTDRDRTESPEGADQPTG